MRNPYQIALVLFSFLATIGIFFFAYYLKQEDREISEEDQIVLFMYTETHPHLRLAYTRANSDGVITENERDAIMDRIIEAMKRGKPSPR